MLTVPCREVGIDCDYVCKVKQRKNYASFNNNKDTMPAGKMTATTTADAANQL